MYDLTIHYPDGPGAVEVVAAAAPDEIELWNVLYKNGRTVIPEIAGGWNLTIKVPTHAKSLLRDLPPLLGGFEAAGIREMAAHQAGIPTDLASLAAANGVLQARQGGTDYPGSVYFTLEDSTTAFFNVDADALGEWIGSYLQAPETDDVRRKLASAGTATRHAFVLVPQFSLAPKPAFEALLHEAPPLPSKPPSLPPGITHVWVTSTWDFGRGFRWDPDGGWSFFSKSHSTP
jgi:hypothetical protein